MRPASQIRPILAYQTYFQAQCDRTKSDNKRYWSPTVEGQLPLAERHLNALAQQHPTEPAIHSLLSLTHYFRGHLGLSAGAAAAVYIHNKINAAAIYQLVDRSWREPDNPEQLFRKGREESAPLVDLLYVVSSRSAETRRHSSANPSHTDCASGLAGLDTAGAGSYEEWSLQDTVRVAQKALEVFPSVTALRLHRRSPDSFRTIR